MSTESKEVEEQSLVVGIPAAEFEKVSYVNTRGAALNYVRSNSDNREEAHCADRAD